MKKVYSTTEKCVSLIKPERAAAALNFFSHVWYSFFDMWKSRLKFSAWRQTIVRKCVC